MSLRFSAVALTIVCACFSAFGAHSQSLSGEIRSEPSIARIDDFPKMFRQVEAALSRGDVHNALVLLNTGCFSGSLDACKQNVDIMLSMDRPPRVATNVVSALEEACVAQDQESCERLAQILEAVIEGCRQNHAESCAESADLKQRPMNQSRYALEEVIADYQKACDLEWGYACWMLGILYRHGDGVDADADVALGYFRRICNPVNTLDCRKAADAYTYPVNGENDASQAIAFLKTGCQGGDELSCWQLEDLVPDVGPKAN